MRSARKVGNARVGCDSLIKTSLEPWKEEFDAAAPLVAPQDPTATPQVDPTTAAQVSTTAAQDSNTAAQDSTTAATTAPEVTTSNNNNNNNGSQSAEVLPTTIGAANR